MGWSLGYDTRWKRDIGYGVPATCDHPRCNAQIDRGLSYVCCHQEPYGGDEGCGLYFCSEHRGWDGKCSRCRNRKPPFKPKGDNLEWLQHKLNDPSWNEWRQKNPAAVAHLKNTIALRFG